MTATLIRSVCAGGFFGACLLGACSGRITISSVGSSGSTQASGSSGSVYVTGSAQGGSASGAGCPNTGSTSGGATSGGVCSMAPPSNGATSGGATSGMIDLWAYGGGQCGCAKGPAYAWMDAGSPSPGPSDVACWSPGSTLPAKCPTASPIMSCSGLPPGPTTDPALIRANLVGRWVSCGGKILGGISAGGLEVGGDLRWRVLGSDATGQFVRRPDLGAGRVTVLDAAGVRPPAIALQVMLERDDPGDSGPFSYRVAVGFDSLRDGLVLRGDWPNVEHYARVAAAPDNGVYNALPNLDGPCSLVGTWDFTKAPGGRGALSFDSYGNWVGGAFGSDLCAGYTMSGTYDLRPGLMEFLFINDCSGCDHGWVVEELPRFDATCTHVTLSGPGSLSCDLNFGSGGDLVLSRR